MSARPQDSIERVRGSATLLLISVFVIATCGLVYELVTGALASYLLGSAVTQFSLVIGLFLSAMGLGSFLSRYVTRRLLSTFLFVELLVGIVGGSAALLLFLCFATIGLFMPVLVLVSLTVGTLVGLEIPLLVRIMRTRLDLSAALSSVLGVDYLGALAAALLFPLLMLPHLGLVRTGFFFGLLNVVVAVIGLYVFRELLSRRIALLLRWTALAVAALLLTGLFTAGKTTALLEDSLYDDDVVYAKTTKFQRLVITRWRNDLRLFIDGNIQFSSIDEFRYHEALVHPPLSALNAPRDILLLGGGDGLAAREVLKYASVRHIDLVDLDPEMTRLFSTLEPLVALNKGSLRDRRVQVTNADAQAFLERTDRSYDAILIDLPDPNNESLARLYTRSFYRLVSRRLRQHGVLVTQATSPFYATDAFWCIANTLGATRPARPATKLHVAPYHADVPSFGDWGFVIASFRPIDTDSLKVRVPTRYLNDRLLRALFAFPKDIGPRDTAVNRLDEPALLRLYARGYQRYNK
ncbi:MAG: polyamine aminopropyltransferase [Deltaproteobacteria bacterium]|nr:polyamine aminopropyltransferase [Deltaproteobacteria bacterium]